MNSDHPPTTIRPLGQKYLNTRFALFQGVIWASFGVLFSFLVPLFRQWGYDHFLIGTLMMLISLSSMISQPLWGLVSDRIGGARSLLIPLMVTASLLMALLPYGEKSVPLTVLLVVLLAAFVQPMPGLLDTWIVRMQNDGHRVTYSLTRGIGSLCFAVTAVGFGALLDRFGSSVRLPVFVGLMTISVAIAVTTQAPSRASLHEPDEKPPHPMKALVVNRRFMGFLLSVLLIYIGNSAQIAFYPVLITQLGGTNTHLGIGLFLMALSEVPVMIFYGSISRRFGHKHDLLLLSMLFFGIKNISVALAPSLALAIGFQVLQAVSFGLYWPSAIRFLNSNVDRSMIATAQMVHSGAAMGLGAILGSFFGGILSRYLGVSSMLVAMGAIGLLGFLLFALLQSDILEKRRIRAMESKQI